MNEYIPVAIEKDNGFIDRQTVTFGIDRTDSIPPFGGTDGVTKEYGW